MPYQFPLVVRYDDDGLPNGLKETNYLVVSSISAADWVGLPVAGGSVSVSAASVGEIYFRQDTNVVSGIPLPSNNTSGYLNVSTNDAGVPFYSWGPGGTGGGGGGATTLNDLTDVTLTSPVNRNVLIYDTSIEPDQWVNSPINTEIAAAQIIVDIQSSANQISSVVNNINQNFISKTVFTESGQLLYGQAANTPGSLTKGSNDEVLTVNAGNLDWRPITDLPALSNYVQVANAPVNTVYYRRSNGSVSGVSAQTANNYLKWTGSDFAFNIISAVDVTATTFTTKVIGSDTVSGVFGTIPLTGTVLQYLQYLDETLVSHYQRSIYVNPINESQTAHWSFNELRNRTVNLLSATNASALKDINYPSTPTNGQVLTWQTDAWVPQNSTGGASALSGLSDTLISDPIITNYVLKWNGSKWIPGPDAAKVYGGLGVVGDPANHILILSSNLEDIQISDWHISALDAHLSDIEGLPGTEIHHYLSSLDQRYLPASGVFSGVVAVQALSSVDYIDFDLNANVTREEGRLYWNSTYKTLELGTANQTSIMLGQEVVVRVLNDTAQTFTRGQVVYISGTQSNVPTIALATASAEATTHKGLGVLKQTLGPNDRGLMSIFGKVSGIDTSIYNIGDILYLGTTPGSLTNVYSPAPSHPELIGSVITVGTSSTGVVLVQVQHGYEIQELHNVSRTPPSATGQVLVWNNTGGYYAPGSHNDLAGLTSGNPHTQYATLSGAVFTGPVDIYRNTAIVEPLLDISGIWNTPSTVTALKLNITDTSSFSGSLLIDVQKNGASEFTVRKDGRVTGKFFESTSDGFFTPTVGTVGFNARSPNGFFQIGNDTYLTRLASGVLQIASSVNVPLTLSAGIVRVNPSSTTGGLIYAGDNGFRTIQFGSTNFGNNGLFAVRDGGHVVTRFGGSYNWENGGDNPATGGLDLRLFRDAANTLGQRNGTNSQTFNIYKTYSDTSNYERAALTFNTSAFSIAPQSLGTGLPRALDLSAPHSGVNVYIGNGQSAGLKLRASGTGANLDIFGHPTANLTYIYTDNGLNLQAVNAVVGITGGTERFRISNTGIGFYGGLNSVFGLGTNGYTPTARVQIADTSANIIALDVSSQWNTASSPTAFRLNVVDTSSSTSSLLADFQISGTSRMSLRKDGLLNIRTNNSIPVIRINNSANTGQAWEICVGSPGNYEGYLMFKSQNNSTPGELMLLPSGAPTFNYGVTLADNKSFGSNSLGALAYYIPYKNTGGNTAEIGFANHVSSAPSLFSFKGSWNGGSGWNTIDPVLALRVNSATDSRVGIGGVNNPSAVLHLNTVTNVDLMNLHESGVSRFKVSKDGVVTAANDVQGRYWFGQGLVQVGTAALIYKDADNIIGLRNGVSAQTLKIYNSYSGVSDYESADLQWAGGVFSLLTNNAGAGLARSINIIAKGTQLSLATGGASTQGYRIIGGHLLAGVDNTYDIGASGATRPKNIYVASGITLGSYGLTGSTGLRLDGLNKPLSFTRSSDAAEVAALDTNGNLTAYSLKILASTITIGDPTNVGLVAAAGGILEQRNAANSQSYRIYNTYTAASSFERVGLNWNASAFEIETEASGTGLARNLVIGTSGTPRMVFSGTGHRIDTYGTFVSPTVSSTNISGTNGYINSLALGGATLGGGGDITLPTASLIKWGTGSTISGSNSLGITITSNTNTPITLNAGNKIVTAPSSLISASSVSATTYLGASLSGSLQDVSITATPTDGFALKWNAASGKWTPQADASGGGGGGVTDHGALTGLVDNDHPQYVLSSTNATLSSTVSDHLTAIDPHTQYALVAGDTFTGPVTVNTSLTVSSDITLTRDTSGTLAQRFGTTTQAFRLYNTFTDASNYEALELSHKTYSSARYAVLSSITAGTGIDNINMVLQPAGTGAFMLQMPNGAISGGNARGSRAIDLQLSRTAADQVANGSNSIAIGVDNRAAGVGSVCIGADNDNSGQGSVAIGDGLTVLGTFNTVLGRNNSTNSNTAGSLVYGTFCSALDYYVTVGGTYAKADLHGQRAYSSGRFTSTGDSQASKLIAFRQTTNGTASELLLDGNSNRLVLSNNTTWDATITIVGRTNTTGAKYASFQRRCLISRGTTAASTQIIGPVQVIGSDIGTNSGSPPIGWNVSISADTTNGSLKLEVTGEASTTIRWVSEITLVEVTYA